MSVGQLTAASVVVFCFGLSVLGGVDFEKPYSALKCLPPPQAPMQSSGVNALYSLVGESEKH
ncbi:hypothetical protein PAL_GLEAN10024083 [Pteropus alecto]|uniref:Uncharacterized protein n=1 Tax=Pteropus alecto TaxID=9402 RepID=L5JZQ9_PTEAL|nr:hypothetical protein PAL_GLEAN10024083 [Pteropus alecto]